ncbi:MAG: polysaccharide biosynthesis/export family protein [Prosthecobacter sp.]
MRFFSFIPAFMAVSALFLSLSLFAQESAGAPPNSHFKDKATLRPGLTISIRIQEDKRKALVLIIAPSGEVCAPYIGFVGAAGLTTDELAAKLKAGLEKNFFRTATVTVRVEAPQPTHTIGCFIDSHVVRGRVVRPGKYDFPSNHDQTVSAALARAGGHTSSKPVPVIKIIRATPQGNKTILVDAHAVLVQKSAAHDLHLRGGDVMIVE